MTNKQRVILIDLNTKPNPVSAAARQLKERLEVIIQEIIDASKTAMIVLSLDAYGTRYRMGTFMWDRLFTSLPQILAEDKRWSVSTRSNVLILSTHIDDVFFSFHIPKVDSENRVPTGAKCVKESIKSGEWLFIDDNLREISSAAQPILLAYDITPQDGLGKITINELIHMGKNDFYSPTIAELYNSATAISAPVAPQETIPPARVAKGTVRVQKETNSEEFQQNKVIR